MEQLLAQMQAGRGFGGGTKTRGDMPAMDTAETVHISSLALLKV